MCFMQGLYELQSKLLQEVWVQVAEGHLECVSCKGYMSYSLKYFKRFVFRVPLWYPLPPFDFEVSFIKLSIRTKGTLIIIQRVLGNPV